MVTDEEVRRAVREAINHLRREHPPLALELVHERSTAHRLAVHLEPFFETWNVDCEYDRDGQLRKALSGIEQCGHRTTENILPDIIVHHRLAEGRANNLLVIEIKKHVAQDVCDRMKLELLTSPTGHYRYQLGLYININRGEFECTWFKDGASESRGQ